MSRFKSYIPEQCYLLPPSVQDELSGDHLCFFLRRVVERLDLSGFEQAYAAEGGALYAPELMLSVWLYAYATGITSARQLERRLVEDLPLRYLAAGARVDNWALSAFRRRHARALNDCFTQVLEMARELGMGRLGKVAIDHLESKLAELPQRLERLNKSGLKKLSRTDPDARFLRTRSGFDLAYTAEIAVSDDHLIVAQRLTQNAADNASLLPIIEQVRQRCGRAPDQILADSGFFSIANLEQMEAQNLDAYVPDSNLARSLNLGVRCRQKACARAHRRMRRKLQTDDGRLTYGRRKAIVEPVFGVLKQQRGLRQFRTRGLANVGSEFTLATLAYNLTRMHAAGLN
jgi:transposase